VARYDGRTQFGTPLVLAVGARRGSWVGVFTPDMPNGKLGWVRTPALHARRVATRIVVSLSRQELYLYVQRRLVRRIPLGIGAPGTSTPTGVFAVTDKLRGSRFSPVYGCCILALSGHQTHLPPGWRGGDRLAIHGGALGAVSTGCLHADTTSLRWLMAHVPLGTRVTIRR
jgi:L,D-transpeptidase-like protein